MKNSLVYLKRNPKTPITVICISALATLVIALTVAIIASIQISTERVVVDQFKDYSVAVYKETDGQAENILVDRIPNAQLYKVKVDFFNFDTAFGTNSAFIYSFFDVESMEAVLQRCGLKLIDGRMPMADCSEVVLHESILTNRNLSVGDKLMSKTIVGSMTGDKIIGIGFISNEEIEQAGFISQSYIIFTNETEMDQARTVLDELESEEWETFTYSDLKKTLKKEMSTLNLIMIMIVAMIVSSLSIAIAALIFTVYSGRYDEFAILNAMGYRKHSICSSVVVEIVILSVSAWVIGYGLSLIGMLIVNETIYKDLGQQMPLFNMKGLCYSVLLPVLSILCAVLPISRKLSKTDLIGIVERR